MLYQRGDVLLVPFPFSDLSTTKVRPAVVISSIHYHLTQPDILLAAITSKVSAAPGLLDYPLSDWRSAGLRYPSAFPGLTATFGRQACGIYAGPWQSNPSRRQAHNGGYDRDRRPFTFGLEFVNKPR